MAVTRSATRAASQLTKSRNTKKQTAKSKRTKAKPTNTNKSLNKTAPHRERLIEWITLRDPIDGMITNRSEIFSLLQQLRKRKGCQVVARARPSELEGIE